MNQTTKTKIEDIVNSNRVVLFMKGTRMMPQCGFSATTVSILDSLLPEYATFNVLEDAEVREGIKQFSDWPTIPQLYINGEFMGGCDVTKLMFNSGELHETLELDPPDKTPPEMEISDDAATMFNGALQEHSGTAIHMAIDSMWGHAFNLAPVEGHEVKAHCNGIDIYMDVATAKRANGIKISLSEGLEGVRIEINNPNAPDNSSEKVKELSAKALKEKLAADKSLHLVDVRTEKEQQQGIIPGAKPMDKSSLTWLSSLPKDDTIVFYCRIGSRSLAAAQHLAQQGYVNVFNLQGGYEAWQKENSQPDS